MTGFELRTTGVESDRSTNWATTPAQVKVMLIMALLLERKREEVQRANERTPSTRRNEKLHLKIVWRKFSWSQVNCLRLWELRFISCLYILTTCCNAMTKAQMAESLWKQNVTSLKWNVFNGPYPASLLYIFGLFPTNNTILITNQCEKYPSSVRHQDSNPWPLEYESSPITTRPGLH